MTLREALASPAACRASSAQGAATLRTGTRARSKSNSAARLPRTHTENRTNPREKKKEKGDGQSSKRMSDERVTFYPVARSESGCVSASERKRAEKPRIESEKPCK